MQHALLTPRIPLAALALASLALVAAPAHAGRPLAVDDAGVSQAGGGQVELWWEGRSGTRGGLYAAPAYAPIAGLELGALLGRDLAGSSTLQGLHAKWQWSPSKDQGCNAASSLAVLHSRAAGGSTPALTLIGSCAAAWGTVHANLGAQREPGLSWLPTWGLALEKTWGQVTGHAEAFGVRHSAPTFQIGARWEWAPGWQLDGSLGRQSGNSLLSVGLKRAF